MIDFTRFMFQTIIASFFSLNGFRDEEKTDLEISEEAEKVYYV
jgi:hypothetical protein